MRVLRDIEMWRRALIDNALEEARDEARKRKRETMGAVCCECIHRREDKRCHAHPPANDGTWPPVANDGSCGEWKGYDA